MENTNFPGVTISDIGELRAERLKYLRDLMETQTKGTLESIAKSGVLSTKAERIVHRAEPSTKPGSDPILTHHRTTFSSHTCEDQSIARTGGLHVSNLLLDNDCFVSVFPSSSGFPEQPLETYDPQLEGDWPPIFYAASRQTEGILESSTFVNPSSPGTKWDIPTNVGTFSLGYRIAETHLSATAFLESAKQSVAVHALPVLSGGMFRGSTDGNGFSYYQVTLQLSVKAMPSGSEGLVQLNVVSDGSQVGAFRSLNRQAIGIKTQVDGLVGPQVLLIDLSLYLVPVQEWGQTGLAMIDMDGLSSAPGKNRLHPMGGLQLSHFVISDPGCQVILAIPTLDPTLTI